MSFAADAHAAAAAALSNFVFHFSRLHVASPLGTRLFRQSSRWTLFSGFHEEIGI